MTRTSIALSVLLALGCIGWAGYTASADTPDYVIHDDGTQLAESYVPGTHVVAVAASDGTTYTITSATAATVDGEPILLAQADTGSAAGPTVTVDTASVTAEPADTGSAATPADKLHDPLSSPGAAFDDLKAAKKVGWPLAVFAGLIMLCKLLARAKSIPWLSALGKGKTAVVVAATGAIATACFNAAADGGAWSATAFAGLLALAHYFDATPKPKAEA